jgi:integrase-like protein
VATCATPSCEQGGDDGIVVVVESRGPKLLDRVREAIRIRHYSRRTEEAYVHWIRRYIVFHNKTHPSTMGASEMIKACAVVTCVVRA